MFPEESLRSLTNLQHIVFIDLSEFVQVFAILAGDDALGENDLRNKRHRIFGSLVKVSNNLLDERLVLLIYFVDSPQNSISVIVVQNFFV